MVRSKSDFELSVVVLAWVLCFLPIDLHAQSNHGDSGWRSGLSTTLWASVGIASTTAGTITSFSLWSSQDRAAHWERHIRNNAVALERDIALGGGSAAQDLAHMLGISQPKYPAFGQLLRNHRKILLPLTAVDRLNEARALEFVHMLYAALKQNPTFANEAQRLKLYFETS